ncbi:MAG TPA: hypothetical protein VN762_09220 [Steroidobacteraceae bacterium]|nr:hypothetical protein [Steroidobacteraceae bacterium]
MKGMGKALAVALVAVLATACETSQFVSTWKSPDAQPVQVNGTKVAAVVMINDRSTRRVAEDTLAAEITRRGGQGIAMYTLQDDDAKPSAEAATRAALEKAGVEGVVVMRPVKSDKDITVTPVNTYSPMYGAYWGGYYGYGWGSSWAGGPVSMGNDIRVDTIVYVETLVYSLKQNKLIWSAQSKTTNPPNTDKFVLMLAQEVGDELKKDGVIVK